MIRKCTTDAQANPRASSTSQLASMDHHSACHRPRRPGACSGLAATLLSAWLAIASPCGLAASLAISGDIAHFTHPRDNSYVFSLDALSRLPQREISTTTDWTPKGTFRGPLLRDVLAKAGAKGASVKIYGADDYSITIPISDFKRYDAILASHWNGRPLQLENYGPFWVMYPLPAMSQAETSGNFSSKLIWQVTRMEVR
ncbi:molybdopterin-dependent oxidoreductase [Chromobacterium alticapitis]|uniref:Oxidoreductase n=1 Tax=Chromobacterium alticapitis TaxID=2073169 RepID=A0A2S5DF37_9NEIS|nr:molybdopterin-dependent oxidoreductase [Chromobacterium alticapitis]POZ61621.1 oxidoreductase [Chromobacterium alticapitis]